MTIVDEFTRERFPIDVADGIHSDCIIGVLALPVRRAAVTILRWARGCTHLAPAWVSHPVTPAY